MQNHVYGWFIDCKHFVTLKVISSMSKLVKWAHNFDANMNYTPIITKQHNNKQMQQQANAIVNKQ
jgi:hypothetical protein